MDRIFTGGFRIYGCTIDLTSTNETARATRCTNPNPSLGPWSSGQHPHQSRGPLYRLSATTEPLGTDAWTSGGEDGPGGKRRTQ